MHWLKGLSSAFGVPNCIGCRKKANVLGAQGLRLSLGQLILLSWNFLKLQLFQSVSNRMKRDLG